MSGPNNEHDRRRIIVENAIASNLAADAELRAAAMLLAEVARTATHGDVLARIAKARGKLEQGKREMASLHPNHEEPKQ